MPGLTLQGLLNLFRRIVLVVPEERMQNVGTKAHAGLELCFAIVLLGISPAIVNDLALRAEMLSNPGLQLRLRILANRPMAPDLA